MRLAPITLANKTIEVVADNCSHPILFYSCGKDSIMLLDLMAPHFDKITLLFMYFVKGMEHCERYLDFSQKRYKNIEIVQCPHFRLSSIRQTGLFCNPEPNIRILQLSDVDTWARQKTGIDWTFYGIKKSDSLNRRLMLKSYGELPISQSTQKVYPLSDLKDADVLRYITKARLLKPIQYGTKRSNAVGFDLDCMLWMRENCPHDLELVYQRFPKSKQVLFEYDYNAKQAEQAREI